MALQVMYKETAANANAIQGLLLHHVASSFPQLFQFPVKAWQKHGTIQKGADLLLSTDSV